MPTQGERQNYLWRPNDNSSTTITRYEQEAELAAPWRLRLTDNDTDNDTDAIPK